MPERFLPVALLCAALLAGCGRSHPGAATLTVSVAASLQNAIEEISPDFARSGVTATFNFGGSGALARQIEDGAPADVFVSAASKPMDELASKGLILDGTRRDLLRNRIVLIVPAAKQGPKSFRELAGASVQLVALGNPDSVPAGDYGRQTLRALGIWDAVAPKLALAKDVRQVLTYVETGEADCGVVYATDAAVSGKVRVAEVAPEGSHQPVVYPAAVLRDSRNTAAARAFVQYLTGERARAVFARHGFTTVAP
ncbi:MAG: molybdate ABC transporter substrate-binding protein [Acidobacteria bacterium]|nr:molybdate ABC transporter substrate-binding protein [Acidobacteriota bacterium]